MNGSQNITKAEISKFDYLAKEESKDIWYRPQNHLFDELRHSINCINGISCGRPIYQPYEDKNSHGVHCIVSISDDANLGVAMRILTRAMDSRYGGPIDWVSKLNHTDTGSKFILWIDSGHNTRNKELSTLVNEANNISNNIRKILDDEHLLSFFWSDDVKHINTKELKNIRKIHSRDQKLNELLKNDE